MSTSGNHDTLRRIVTSAAILGAALVFFDGGRGLTGRAGGGSVGCGGAYEEELASEDLRVRSFERSDRVSAVSELAPVLDPGRLTVSFRPAPKVRFTPPEGRPNPTPMAPSPSSGPVPVSPPAPRAGPDLLDALVDVGAGRFAEVLRNSGFAAVVSNPYRRFTVFAPSDDAWEKLRVERPDLFEAKNATLLEEVVGQHVVARELRATEMKSGSYAALVPGAPLEVADGGAIFTVASRSGVEAEVDPSSEILAANGVVMRADAVLIPYFTVWSHLRNLGFDLFVSAIEATQQVDRFVDVDQPMTVLVPSDEAFRIAGWTVNRLHDPGERARVQAIVAGHVLSESYSLAKLVADPRETSDGAMVKAFMVPAQPPMIESPDRGSTAAMSLTDFPAANGVLHGIDALLVD